MSKLEYYADVVKFLSQYLEADEQLENIQKKRQALRDKSIKITGVATYEADRVQRTSDPCSRQRLSDMIIEVDLQLEKTLSKWIDSRDNVEIIISSVRGIASRKLLMSKYIHDESWKDIAVRLGYDYHYTTHTLHIKALEEVKQLLKST